MLWVIIRQDWVTIKKNGVFSSCLTTHTISIVIINSLKSKCNLRGIPYDIHPFNNGGLFCSYKFGLILIIVIAVGEFGAGTVFVNGLPGAVVGEERVFKIDLAIHEYGAGYGNISALCGPINLFDLAFG